MPIAHKSFYFIFLRPSNEACKNCHGHKGTMPITSAYILNFKKSPLFLWFDTAHGTGQHQMYHAIILFNYKISKWRLAFHSPQPHHTHTDTSLVFVYKVLNSVLRYSTRTDTDWYAGPTFYAGKEKCFGNLCALPQKVNCGSLSSEPHTVQSILSYTVMVRMRRIRCDLVFAEESPIIPISTTINALAYEQFYFPFQNICRGLSWCSSHRCFQII